MFSLNKSPKFSSTNRWWVGRDFKRTTVILTLMGCMIEIVFYHLNTWFWKFYCFWSMWYSAFPLLTLESSVTISYFTRSHKSDVTNLQKLSKEMIQWITYPWRAKGTVAPCGALFGIVPKPCYSMSQTWGFLLFSLGKLFRGPKDLTVLEFFLISCLKFPSYVNYHARYS